MDRNSIIGLLLIGTLMVGWMVWMSPSKEEIAKKRQQDSIELARIQEAEKKAVENAASASPVTTAIAPPPPDTLSDSAKAVLLRKQYGNFAEAVNGENKSLIIENELMKITLSSLGGNVESVELKKYRTYDSLPLVLFFPDSSRFSLQFASGGRVYHTDSLYFEPIGDGFSVQGKEQKDLAFRLYAGAKNRYLEYKYGLSGDSYLVNFRILSVGMQDVISSNASDYTLNWEMKTPSQEKSVENERMSSTVYFKYEGEDEEPDYISERSDEGKNLDSKIKWVAFKQQFFTSAIIADNAFNKEGAYIASFSLNSPEYIKSLSATLSIPYNHAPFESFGMKFYFGPNHYKTLKAVGSDLERVIPLGWKIFGWVNKFIVIPIFNWLNAFNLNFGIIILILTIFIKLLLLPIAFRTHLSSAKMKVLKPEIDEINKKYGMEEPMKKQQAMMTLYKKAGVNPMAGCIPVLLQMPILIALFNFFPASIELRQESFLWAEDLSTYDSVLNLPFTIPFYGSHVSLFTLLMTLSTILYTYSNSQLMGSTNQMPGMKWMMYLMPVMFMGIFNSYSSGLSYYYFLANMVTFAQTFLFRSFIDEQKLHRQIQENKKKPVKASNFQKKLEDMARQRQQQQQRGKRK